MVRCSYICDVLVIGGGLAGCWAALAAARAGARVILAEKGYVGTSGVTATAGPGHWWVQPDPPELRVRAVAERAERGLGLADPTWMARIIDLTWKTLPTLARHYRFPEEGGIGRFRGLRGPEYMRAMRMFCAEAGVRIFDQSPVHELLMGLDGAVAGALGEHRQEKRDWQIRAGAVVVASGGCAFFSHLLGSRTNTGDGYLMAAEAGAELSGMEFSSYYTVAPARSTMTRSMAFSFARYFDEAGHELDIPAGPSSIEALAKAITGGRVFCSLDRVPEDIRAIMRHVQPNFVIPFDRWRLDPYRDRFEVTLRGEGTVRGIGGLRIAGDDCRTTVPGLYAAGDAASREYVAGAVSGGGAQNSAWALSSGQWAGQGATRFAREHASQDLPAERVAPQAGRASDIAAAEVIAAVRDDMETPAKNLFRSGAQLRSAMARMDGLASALKAQGFASRWQGRELTAAVATARWSLAAAEARTESRGMHRREDHPLTDPLQARRLTVSGVDVVTVAPEPVEARAAPLKAAS